MRSRGFAPGSRVGVFLSNRPEYFEILFGAWFAGLVVAPPCIDCRRAPRTVTYLCCKSLLRCVACHVAAPATACVRCGLDYGYMGGFVSARYF